MASKPNKNQQSTQVPRSNQPNNFPESHVQRLDRWLESLNLLLGEIASVEVKTSVVESIPTEKFIPWQAYLNLYTISRPNLEKLKIHSSIQEHYLSLRRQLELEYAFLLINPQSELYDRQQSKQIKHDLAILAQPNSNWEVVYTRLPNPIDSDNRAMMTALHKLLQNYPFLRTLRKLEELKNTLDRRNQILWRSKSAENIFAQTKIELGGQISNCYAQELLSHPDKQTLLKLHQEGVEAGEKHWQGLLEFLITIVHKYN